MTGVVDGLQVEFEVVDQADCEPVRVVHACVVKGGAAVVVLDGGVQLAFFEFAENVDDVFVGLGVTLDGL